MSKAEDRCAGAARDGGPCTFTRSGHADGKPHAFVEPAPQAENVPVLCEKHGREDCPRPDHAPPNPDAAVRAIADEMIRGAGVELGPRGKRLVLDVLAAGRALGRDEAEKLLRARADVAYVLTDLAAPRVREALHDCGDAIRALRGKR